MFTGIIESMGRVVRIVQEQSNRHFLIDSPISNELKVDQSLAHNGVCLTVTKITDEGHWVTAVDETLKKSNLGDWKEGSVVNLERSMPANGRFDGHIVQGHVDQAGICTSVEEVEGSWLFDFEYDSSGGNITVEKGSICIDGVSLTCFNSKNGSFRVTIIPYTYEHTTFGVLKAGDRVNLEFDILGKYIQRLLQKQV
jgi:riboflavin synthase